MPKKPRRDPSAFTPKMDFHRQRRVDFADHEVFMAFYNDTGAEAFMEWWHLEGRKAFVSYCLTHDWECEVQPIPMAKF